MVKTDAEAMELPLIAAKTAFAATVAMPSPPATRRNARPATSKVSRPTPDTLTKSPMATNRGMTPKE